MGAITVNAVATVRAAVAVGASVHFSNVKLVIPTVATEHLGVIQVKLLFCLSACALVRLGGGSGGVVRAGALLLLV
jgi:hypothetical protein